MIFFAILCRNNLLYHPEQRAGEYHSEDEQNRHDDPRTTNNSRIVSNQIRRNVQTALGMNILRRRVVLAGLKVGQRPLAAGLWNRTAPVVVRLDAAALEPFLGRVPGLGDGPSSGGAVQPHRRVHLLLHRLGYLFAEYVSEDAADQHRYEDQENQNKVRQQHALELLGGPDAPEEGQQTDEGGGRNQHVNRSGEQVRSEQLVDEVLVDQRPDAQPEHDGTTEEYDEIGDEHAILDTLPAAVHSAAGTHGVRGKLGAALAGFVGVLFCVFFRGEVEKMLPFRPSTKGNLNLFQAATAHKSSTLP